MIRFELDGKAHRAYFIHEYEDGVVQDRAGVERRVRYPFATQCIIKEGQPVKVPETDTTVPVGFGRAVCHPNDRFDKEKGRKVALAYALDDMGVKSKAQRFTVWQAYFAR